MLKRLLLIAALLFAPIQAFAAVAYGGEAHSANAAPGNNGTSFTVNSTNPAGSALSISAGDKLLVMVVVTLTSGDPGAISVTGFTKSAKPTMARIVGPISVGAMRRVETPPSRLAGPARRAARPWAIISFTGAATGAPPSASLAVDSGSNTSMVAPSVTASTASDMLFSGWTQFGVNGTYTVPGR